MATADESRYEAIQKGDSVSTSPGTGAPSPESGRTHGHQSMELQKEILRRDFLKLRSSLTLEERRAKDMFIRERLLSWPSFKNAGTVFFYCSKGSEVDTRILIEEALIQGKRVVLPQTLADGNLAARQILHFPGDCLAGAFGILEPKLSMPVIPVSDIDLFIIPGSVFDLSGARLGWGMGYFDQYLAEVKKALKAALAYEIQVCQKLPVQRHDVKMDVLITEKRILSFGKNL